MESIVDGEKLKLQNNYIAEMVCSKLLLELLSFFCLFMPATTTLKKKDKKNISLAFIFQILIVKRDFDKQWWSRKTRSTNLATYDWSVNLTLIDNFNLFPFLARLDDVKSSKLNSLIIWKCRTDWRHEKWMPILCNQFLQLPTQTLKPLLKDCTHIEVLHLSLQNC